MAQMTALRRRMIDDMTVRNLSPATQQSYVYAVAKFSRFFGCSPDCIDMASLQRSDLVSVVQRNSGQVQALLVALRVKNASNGILR